MFNLAIYGPRSILTHSQAYLEFFVSPDLLSPLIRRIERDPRITYYAVNKQGDLRTNTHSESPNAVTWGVFPGKEIVQVSFSISLLDNGRSSWENHSRPS